MGRCTLAAVFSSRDTSYGHGHAKERGRRSLSSTAELARSREAGVLNGIGAVTLCWLSQFYRHRPN